MKQKMSISVDESKVKMIEELVQKGVFRNKSHAIELALIKMLEVKQNE